MHEHTEECKNGCVWLSMFNQMMADLIKHGEGEENDGTSHA